MTGLVPAINVFGFGVAFKTWTHAAQVSEATPFFERLCAGMTIQSNFIPLYDLSIALSATSSAPLM
jgi:hypothetical protein